MSITINTPRATVVLEGIEIDEEEIDIMIERVAHLSPLFAAGMIVPEAIDPFAADPEWERGSIHGGLSTAYEAGLVAPAGEPNPITVRIYAHGGFWPLLQAVYELVTFAPIETEAS
jgi:hypothetical protein